MSTEINSWYRDDSEQIIHSPVALRRIGNGESVSLPKGLYALLGLLPGDGYHLETWL